MKVKTNKLEKGYWFLIVLALLISLPSLVYSTDPEPPDVIDIVNSTRRDPNSAGTLEVQAGNVSQITLQGTTVTRFWAGFYGNISGTITLDSSNNHTMYDWTLADAEGEIYASETSVDWTSDNVLCYNYSWNGDSYYNLSEWEEGVGMDYDSVDGINETFLNNMTHDSFYAGTTYIDGSSDASACPVVRLYNGSEESNSSIFEEIILYDNSTQKPIFAAILEENGQLGFNNELWDFELLVTENGSAGNTALTTYYFYVELE